MSKRKQRRTAVGGKDDEQIELFRAKAREVGCSESPGGEDEVMRRLARQKRHQDDPDKKKPNR